MNALEMYEQTIEEIEENCSTHHGLTIAGQHIVGVLDSAMDMVAEGDPAEKLVEEYNKICQENWVADYAKGLLYITDLVDDDTPDVIPSRRPGELEAAANEMLRNLLN